MIPIYKLPWQIPEVQASHLSLMEFIHAYIAVPVGKSAHDVYQAISDKVHAHGQTVLAAAMVAPAPAPLTAQQLGGLTPTRGDIDTEVQPLEPIPDPTGADWVAPPIDAEIVGMDLATGADEAVEHSATTETDHAVTVSDNH